MCVRRDDDWLLLGWGKAMDVVALWVEERNEGADVPSCAFACRGWGREGEVCASPSHGRMLRYGWGRRELYHYHQMWAARELLGWP